MALKVISPDLARDRQFRARFEREASLAARIGHPTVIPIFDWDEEDAIPYIIMPLLETANLAAYLRGDGRFPPEHAARITNQIAAALDAAHALDLVHRDVKRRTCWSPDPSLKSTST